ncbi:single-stranded DNA-binding protein [Arthrobacter sp. VKM Ac-2550]|uniref:single-stranded DNA-binding protein n=1 Tax=Crystallibacter permensis TaxID=1938888 RepID=UPI002226EFAB|nr:single-stranded DNA-binding protein [Arthrobacter sp. VKM Ac-2550]MCW2132928.1 single-strand DNA-binding protein [Arthrobacter sp. VKM Ac-2550]
MANEQFITIRGRLTGPPELRFTPSGAAVANFTIAANARQFDKQSNEWKDKEAIFWRCSAWKEMAENVSESLDKGMAVIALAELESRSYETTSGEKRTVTEARIESIGPDLRWVSAQVNRAQRQGIGNDGFGGNTSQNGDGADPWGAPANTGNGWT